MSEKMEYIHLWELQLLTKFMLNKTPLEYSRDSIAIAEDEGSASPLTAVLGQISHYKIRNKIVFNVNSNDFSVRITKNKRISQDDIKTHLTVYCKNFEEDNIIDYDPDRKHDSYYIQYNNFLNSIDDSLNLKDYKIESIYLPVVLVGCFKDLVKINSYELNLPLRKDYAHDVINVVERFVDEDYDAPVLVQDFMSMNCKVDISKFVSIPAKTVKNKSSKAPELKFSRHEIAVIKKVEELKGKGRTFITTEELMDVLGDKLSKNKKQNEAITISKIISSVNSKFKKLNKRKLLGRKVSETISCDSHYEII